MRSLAYRPLLAPSLAFSLAACATTEAPPREPEPPPPVRAAAPVPSPFGDFIQRKHRSQPMRLALPDGTTLALVDNQRVVFGAEGQVLGVADGPFHARGIAAIPAELGGGIAIHGGGGLFRAETPLGAIVRVLAVDVDHVSFGPRGALVSTGDGRRRLVDLATGALTPVTPAFAVSMVVAGPRMAGALLADGSARFSRDGGATWAATPSHPRPFYALEKSGGAIVVVDDRDVAFRLEDQRLVPIPLPPPAIPPAKPDPRWIGSEDPLEAAVARGAVLDEAHAIVSARGALFVLDRATGAIVSADTGALPPNRPCTAIGLSRDILFACPDDGRLSVLRRPRTGGPVQAEMTFAGSGRLVRGDGDALLYTGTCEGDSTKIGVACLRKADGTWAVLDRSALFAAQPAGVVLAWVPTGSSALAILGGDAVGVLDGASGERSVLEKAAGQKLAAVVSPRTDLVEHRFRAVAGAIEGWSQSGDFIRIEKGGAQVKLAPFKMSSVRFAGPLGLASGPDDTLWQTRDWGRTFVEVPTPPLRVGAPSACGEVGCTFAQWIRRGWSDERARPKKLEHKSEPTASLPAPPLPELRCAVSGAQTTKAQAPDARDSPLGYGAELLRTGDVIATYADGADDPMGRLQIDEDLRGVESGPGARADGAIDPASSRRIRFTAPFDPTAAIQTATIPMRQLVEAARRGGEPRPGASELEGAAFAVPVLTGPGAPTELLVTRDATLLGTWVRGKDVAVLATSTPGNEVGAVTGAARRGDGLVLAISDASGGVHLFAASPGSVSTILDVPGGRETGAAPQQMDTVAVAADGQPAMLRVFTRTAPDATDPAMIVRPGAASVPLAPWSTLAADGSAGCEGNDGFRAIVSTSPPWIQVGPVPVDAGRMVARVRWSEKRVCLEAVEVTNASHETPNGEMRSLLVATFGAKPAGGLVLVGRGVELREPRRCEIVPVAPAPR